jgi:hypothetical protein
MMTWRGCGKKAAVAESEVGSYSGIRLEELRENSKTGLKVLDLCADILNRDLPNTEQGC